MNRQTLLIENDWFNREHDLNITKSDLMELLRIATKNQLFQFEGKLYEQVDGVAMGSPLGPLMANAFMCKIEKQLERENKLPIFYKRFVDDTLSAMPDPEAASAFLETLNKSHPSIDFTMELEENGRLPFLGMDVIRNGCRLDTTVYRKPTDKGLLLHYHSHVDARYKRSLLNTMLNRAFQLSSTWQFFHEECERLKEIFSRLRYPDDLANAFMCKIEKQLERENKLPIFYKRFVDDTLSAMPDPEAASAFLETLNKSHPSIDFTMELEENGRLPFLGMDVIRNGCRLDTTVYRKPTDKGLLLHYHSHVDARYKRSLLNTMLNRAFQLSSTWQFFHEECERLKEIFSRLRYPDDLVQSTIRRFIESKSV